jgi:hypothetical protein
MGQNGNDIRYAIDQLKAGVDAAAVALVDRRRARTQGSAPEVPEALRDALERLSCLGVDWAGWYRDLLGAEEHNTTCQCGDRHQLHGLVLDDRWVLALVTRGLLLPDGSFQPTKAAAYAEWVGAIRFFLEEEARPGSGPRGRGGGEPGSAELAIPLSWHRQDR